MINESAKRPEARGDLPQDDRRATANALHSAAVRLLRTARAADTVMNLDGARASLLSVLVFAGPQSVSALAQIEQVSAPAITKTVNALVQHGLAKRTHSGTDRRVVLVSATSAGRRRLERGRAARVRVIAKLFADLSDADVAVLDHAAEILLRRL